MPEIAKKEKRNYSCSFFPYCQHIPFISNSREKKFTKVCFHSRGLRKKMSFFNERKKKIPETFFQDYSLCQPWMLRRFGNKKSNKVIGGQEVGLGTRINLELEQPSESSFQLPARHNSSVFTIKKPKRNRPSKLQFNARLCKIYTLFFYSVRVIFWEVCFSYHKLRNDSNVIISR